MRIWSGHRATDISPTYTTTPTLSSQLYVVFYDLQFHDNMVMFLGSVTVLGSLLTPEFADNPSQVTANPRIHC
jgi:hypothetical protein